MRGIMILPIAFWVILSLIGLVGWAEEIPRPSPLVTLAEARADLPALRMPANLPSGVVGPVFAVRRLEGHPVIALYYSSATGEPGAGGFQLLEAPASMAQALAPKSLDQLPERSAYGLVRGDGPRAVARTIAHPRREVHGGFPVDLVSARVCESPLCERRMPYVVAMTCDTEVCVRIEGALDEKTALELLLSAFQR